MTGPRTLDARSIHLASSTLMRRADVSRLAAHFAAHGVLLPDRSPAARGREAIEARFRSGLPSAKVPEFEVVFEEFNRRAELRL